MVSSGMGRQPIVRFLYRRSLEHAKIVAAGAFHSVVVTEDNHVWAAGSNKDGQFGDGSTISRNSFKTVPQTVDSTWRTMLGTYKF